MRLCDGDCDGDCDVTDKFAINGIGTVHAGANRVESIRRAFWEARFLMSRGCFSPGIRGGARGCPIKITDLHEHSSRQVSSAVFFAYLLRSVPTSIHVQRASRFLPSPDRERERL